MNKNCLKQLNLQNINKIYTFHMNIEERIRGVNFDGSAQIAENQLKIQLIQYIKGSIYKFSVTSQELVKSFKRFLVIKKLEELFQELVVNHQSYIDQSQQLIIPIEVQYRGRTQPLNLEIPLEKVIIEDEKQLNQKYLKEIQKMSKQNLTIDRYREKTLVFVPDPNSSNLKFFDLNNRNTIRFTGNNIHTILNHMQPLSKVGIHSIKAKVIKTYAKNIIFGVCAFDIRYSVNNYHSPYFLGLSFSERTILGNNKSDVAIPIVQVVEGKSVIKVQYDMNKSVISWFLDDNFLCARRIPNEITIKQVYPLISFYNLGDAVEILN